jgi:hypothetical protein
MTMKISSHQPNFIPWCGYFYKIAVSDAFVIADDVDFTRKSFINRNRIKTPSGPQWLTLPVKKAPLGTPINEVEISDRQEVERLLAIVRSNYGRAPHFIPFFEKMENTLRSSGHRLAEINTNLIRLIMDELQISTPLFITSEMEGISGTSTERIISICGAMKADTYISGFGGQKYQSSEMMRENGIDCRVYQFRHPEYRQLWGEFIPNMSVIDLIFNCGPEAAYILKNT